MLIEILSSFGSFFRKDHQTEIAVLLQRGWYRDEWITAADAGEQDLVPFVKLSLAFGTAFVKDLVVNPNDPGAGEILSKY